MSKTQYRQIGIGKLAKKKLSKQRNTQSTSREHEIIPKHAWTNEKTNRNNAKLVQTEKPASTILQKKIAHKSYRK